MKLHLFFKTLKFQGAIIILRTGIQIEFLYQKEGKIMITISLKSTTNKELTKKLGFQIYHWNNFIDIVPTKTAWMIYNNLTNDTKETNTNVVIKQPDNDIWLEEDEI